MNAFFAPLPLLEKIRSIIPADLPIYLVGGAVRDLLLGRTVHDLDFALPGNAIPTCRRVADALGAPFYPLDTQRDVGRIVLTGKGEKRTTLDFAAFRNADLERDLRDRDFTLNAIAVDMHQPQDLIDPLGGAQDLQARLLRACSPNSLSNDPVRILRAVRLAMQFELSIELETRSLIRDALPNLSQVSVERLRDELFRILENPKAVSALRALDVLGALDIIFPELAALKGVEQSPPHTYDVWSHSLQTAQNLSDLLDVLAPEHDPDLAANWAMGLVSLRLGRFRQPLSEHRNTQLIAGRPLYALLLLAALYHDISKPQTRQTDNLGRVRFLEHEQLGAQVARQRAAQLRLSNLEIDRVETIVRNHMRPLLLAQSTDQPTPRAIYRFFRDTKEAGVDVCLLALADTLATYGPNLPQETWARQLDVVRALLEAWWERREENVSPPPLLSGNDLIQALDLKPGPQVGILLEAIREAQANGELHNREQALVFASAHLRQRHEGL